MCCSRRRGRSQGRRRPLCDQHIIFTSPGTTRATIAMARCLSSFIVREHTHTHTSLFLHRAVLCLQRRIPHDVSHYSRSTAGCKYNFSFSLGDFFPRSTPTGNNTFIAAAAANDSPEYYRIYPPPPPPTPSPSPPEPTCNIEFCPYIIFVYKLLHKREHRGVKQTRHCGSSPIVRARHCRRPRLPPSYTRRRVYSIKYYTVYYYTI